jgi:Flp pilus assembly CpaE family ATPase
MIGTCDLYMTIQKQMPMNYKKLEHEEHDSSNEAEVASASNAATEILKIIPQAIGKSPIKMKKRSILRKRLRKSPM